MTKKQGSIENFLEEEREAQVLATRRQDWRHLKALSLRIAKETHPETRKQYTTDLYNGVKDYWNKYHVKFDFCREPTKGEE